MNPPFLPVAAAFVLAAASGRAAAADRPGGFVAVARYTGPGDTLIGERYVHAATGVPVVLLRIESVPQAFIHVGTPPVSDRGEPHTQEHLLLGKGVKGKSAALAREMSLVESTAYTSQTYTSYSLNCASGPDTFFRVLEQSLDALLFPDYSDAEVEREVWHLGVAEGPGAGERRLVDRGTVFNEMLVGYEKRWVVWYALGKRLYGEGHPLGWSAGGDPDAIRTMTPAHIHAFHRATYHLSPNLGLILSLPPEVAADLALARLGAAFDRLAAGPGHAERPRARAAIPAPRPSADRSILVVPYPNENEEDAGEVILAWPPRPQGTIEEHLLRRLLLEALAGGETSHLHRLLLDRATRRLEVEARAVWGNLEVTEVTEGAMLGLGGYAPSGVGEEPLRAIERLVRAEVDRLAALVPGDPALAAFNRRAGSRLRELERGLKVALGSPPLFGRRGGGGFWYDHLALIDRAGGEERSLTLAGAIAAVRARIEGEGANPWPAVIDGLGLRDAPIIAASRASRAEIARRRTAREERLREGLAALRAEAAARASASASASAAKTEAAPPPPLDDGALLGALARAQEQAASALEARDRAIPPPPLAPDIPTTLDDRLVSSQGRLGDLPVFRAHFESMSAAEVALYLRLDGVVRDDEVHLLPLVPSLLTGAGLRAADGARLAYDALQDTIQRDLLELSASYDLAPDTGRYELVLTAAGADPDEARAALAWLARCIAEADLSADNLPRLLDIVDERTRALRARLGSAEERWVQDPAQALRFQHDRLYLSAGSMHAALYHLFRLRRLLEAPPEGEARAALAAWCALLRESVAEVDALDDLGPLFERLRAEAPEAVRERLAGPALDALRGLAADLPPETLAADLVGLAAALERDLARPPAETLDALRALLDRLYATERARLVLTGRAATLDALVPAVEGLLEVRRGVGARAAGARSMPRQAGEPRPGGAPAPGAVSPPAARPATAAVTPAGASGAPEVEDEASRGVVRARLAARRAASAARASAEGAASPEGAAAGDAPLLPPVHMGLVLPTAGTGVFVFSSASAALDDTGREALLGELASSVYAGAGPHAFFMQTWGAGLAYSNGLRVRPTRARIHYYAERCPDLVQTMRFVADLARHERGAGEQHLLAYAATNLVSATRAADLFPARARAQAADLEDGITPERVRCQREALLAIARDPRAWDEVRRRAPAMTGRVLVGLGAPSRAQAGGVFLAIAPERLLAAWEAYVREHEGEAERVHRIYPSDFWVR